MAAPVLSAADQKKSLSGKKIKKRAVKNVLGIPLNLKVESPLIKAKEGEKLTKILNRLLPLARLPIQQNTKFKKSKEEKEPTPEKLECNNDAKNKRSQLSLGVNEVNKSIRKGLISAVLLASDIQPKFLVQHLNLLCTQNKIPFLHVPNLREVTKNCLGFPCIALGFKNNFSDFSEAVDEINIIASTLNIIPKGEDEESSIGSSDDDSEVTDSEESQDSEIKSDTKFTYLYRTSTKTRTFVPESEKSKVQPQKSELDFITIPVEDDSEIKTKINVRSGTAKNSLKKRKKKKMLNLKDLDASDDEDDWEVVNKKPKIGWEIDKRGNRPKFRYQPANLLRVFSNPDRINKKNK